jgi:phosphoketolase
MVNPPLRETLAAEHIKPRPLGRHRVFNGYEAFVHIIDSMFNQHAKWPKLSRELSRRVPVASLNCLPASHLWRQDHNMVMRNDLDDDPEIRDWAWTAAR